MPWLRAAGHRLEYAWHGPGPEHAPTLVFLHEGLGSVAMWKRFPEALAQATGCGALSYSRWGYGKSESLDALRTPRAVDYMHREAREVLPEVLAELAVREPVLVGHSDGGSIALIYAGSSGPGSRSSSRLAHAPAPRALILEAPHVFVEDISLASIASAREAFRASDLARRLARYHDDVDGAFRGWNDIWLHPDFRAWNIEEYLGAITCPVLVIQGEDDEYGTCKQVDAIASQIPGPVETLILPRCGHAPHRDQPEHTLAAMAALVRSVIEPAAPER